jgi:hypothetical protein
MVTQVRNLAVSAAMDATAYSSGAEQKVAADKAMSASGKEAAAGIAAVGQAATQSSTKVAQASDSIERLKRSYVTGYAAASDFDRNVRAIGAGLDKGKLSADQAANAIENLHKKYGLIADSAALAQKGQVGLAQAVEKANMAITAQQKAAPANSPLPVVRPVSVAANQNAHGDSAGLRQFQTRDIMFQLQDVFSTAMQGMSPKTIAFQQGPQLADAVTMGSSGGALGGVKALGAGFMSLLNPISLITIGLTGAGAAAIQYFARSTTAVKTVDDAIKAHSDSLNVLKETYGQLGDAIKVAFNASGNSGSDAILRTNETVMRAVTRQKTTELSSTLSGTDGYTSFLTGKGTSIKSLQGLSGDQAQFQPAVNALLDSVRKGAPDLDKFNASVQTTFQTLLKSSDSPTQLQATADAVLALGTNALTVSSSIKVLGEDGKETSQSLKPFETAIDRLKVGIADGHPDLAQFNADVELIGRSKGLQSIADQVIVLGREVLNLNVQLQELDLRKQALFNDQGPTGTLLSRGTTNEDDAGKLALYESQQKVAQQRSQQAFDAQLGGIAARSPGERAQAARNTAAAQYNDSETPAQRNQRILQAGNLALAQSEHTLAEAQRDRAVNLDKIVSDQQMEIDLIGKTAGETAALRKEYELTSQLRIDAAKNGIDVDQNEIALIKQKAAELGKLTEALNKAKLNDDLGFERSQLFRSTSDQQIASRQRGAGLPVDLNSNEAQQMRQNLQTAALQQGIKGFFSDFQQQLVTNGGKVGEAFGAALKTSLLNSLTKIGDAAMDKIVNTLVAAFTGGGAGTSGGIGSGAVSLLAGGLSGKTLTAANSNVAGAVSALPVIGQTKTGIDLSAISAGGLTAKVASTAAPQFQGLLDDLKAKGYPISSLGEGGYSYRNVAGTGHLSNHAFGNALDINPAQNKQAMGATGNWSQYGIDPTAEASKFGLTYGGNWKLPDTMHFQVDKAADASKALEKLAGSTGAATTGLDKIGQLSTSFFPSAPQASSGGGGFGGFFSSLFGGGAFKPIGAQATRAASGSITGLFADGTDFAPGGPAIVGERGAEIVNLPRGSQVIPTHTSRSMMAAAANSNGGSGGGGRSNVDVGVSVDDEGNLKAYVKKVSQEHADKAVQSGLFNYTEGMRQGGFGRLQSNFAAEKG